jgi:hypothetical protein
MNARPITRFVSPPAALIAVLAATACSRDAPHLPLPAGVPAAITIAGGPIYPESLTSTRDGSVIIGSIGTQQIFRAKPAAADAAPWIAPGTDGIKSIFGVFADEASNTLYACSNIAPPTGTPAPEGTLHAFDLTTGAPQGHHPLPTAGALCNDIAVGSDGTAYATDSNNMEIVRLKRGAPTLEVWAGHGAFGTGGVLDGIAVLGNRVIVTTLDSSRMFSVPIQPDGSAGAVVEVKLSRRLERPDGIRSIGPDTLLVAEGGVGRLGSLWAKLKGGPGGPALAEVTLNGDSGTVTTLQRGFPEGPVSVTLVGTSAYVLEGRLKEYYSAAGTSARAFHATAVEVAKGLEIGKP